MPHREGRWPQGTLTTRTRTPTSPRATQSHRETHAGQASACVRVSDEGTRWRSAIGAESRSILETRTSVGPSRGANGLESQISVVHRGFVGNTSSAQPDLKRRTRPLPATCVAVTGSDGLIRHLYGTIVGRAYPCEYRRRHGVGRDARHRRTSTAACGQERAGVEATEARSLSRNEAALKRLPGAPRCR
jgi:hypothetical protein